MTSYIYFIQATGDGPIKIGITRFNPRRRLVKIQSDCPWPVTLVGAIEGTVSQEQRIHDVLAAFRTQGEWFRPHPVVSAAIRTALECGRLAPFEEKGKRVAKYDHPLCRYRAREGVTLESVAVKAGLTTATLSRFESGRNRPNPDSMRALRRVTGISFAELRPDLAKLLNLPCAGGVQ